MTTTLAFNVSFDLKIGLAIYLIAYINGSVKPCSAFTRNTQSIAIFFVHNILCLFR